MGKENLCQICGSHKPLIFCQARNEQLHVSVTQNNSPTFILFASGFIEFKIHPPIYLGLFEAGPGIYEIVYNMDCKLLDTS